MLFGSFPLFSISLSPCSIPVTPQGPRSDVPSDDMSIKRYQPTGSVVYEEKTFNLDPRTVYFGFS